MIAWAARLVLLVLAVLVGGSVLPQVLAYRPDVALLVVVGVAAARGPWAGVVLGVAAGWLIDLVPPGAEPLGAGALAYAAAGALAGRLRWLRRVSVLAPVLLTLAAALLVQGARALVALAVGAPLQPVAVTWSIALTVTLGLLVVPAVLALEDAVARRRAQRVVAP